jgi:hypothetical protein
MKSRSRATLLTVGLLTMAAMPMRAQQPTSAAQTPAAPPLPMPAVGDQAPDFSIRGATRYGLLKDRARLSDYRGQTVVLAFFVIARTRG